MFGIVDRMRRGWSLSKASLAVLRADKEIALLPALSAVVLVLTVGPLAGGGVLLTGLLEGAQPGPASYVLLFLVYVVGYFVTIYFNAAVVACANVRFEGGDPTLRDGLSRAWERKGPILGWALLAATVGMIIRALRRRADGLADALLLGGVGLAWNVATYFVVPVIVETGAGPVDAIKRSGSTVREAWGEALAGEAGVGIVFFLAAVVWFLLTLGLAIAVPVGSVVVLAVVLMIAGLGVIAVAGAAADGILKAALYRYARTGEIPSDFQGADVPERTGSPTEPASSAR